MYLDAVLYPRVRDDAEIVMQEGWHYELDHADDELTYKGVVFNEMKGCLLFSRFCIRAPNDARTFPRYYLWC